MEKNYRKITSYLSLNTVLNLKRKQNRRIRCKDHIVYPDFHVMSVQISGDKNNREYYYKYLKRIKKNSKNHCTLKEFNKEFGMILTIPSLYVRQRPYNGKFFKKDDIFMTWNKNGKFYRNDKVPSTLCKKYFPNSDNYEFDDKILLNLPTIIEYKYDNDYSFSYYENSVFQNTNKLFNKKYGCFLTLPTTIAYSKNTNNEHYSYRLDYYLQKYHHRIDCNPITGELLPAHELFDSKYTNKDIPSYQKNICFIYGINVTDIFYKDRYSDEYLQKNISIYYQQNNYPKDEDLFLNFKRYITIDNDGKIYFDRNKKNTIKYKKVRIK
jgi:hypothetical protein